MTIGQTVYQTKITYYDTYEADENGVDQPVGYLLMMSPMDDDVRHRWTCCQNSRWNCGSM